MPNIELYGFDEKQASGVVAMIMKVFDKKPYSDDYVMTEILSRVTDHANRSQPFLRLVSTSNEHLEEIIEELRSLKFDVEVMILDRFIPKEC